MKGRTVSLNLSLNFTISVKLEEGGVKTAENTSACSLPPGMDGWTVTWPLNAECCKNSYSYSEAARHLLNFTHRAEDFLWLEVSLLVGRPVSNDGGGQL